MAESKPMTYLPKADRGKRTFSESRRLTGTAGSIVQTARMLFETNGVARTTVKEIAVEANVARELIYYYFEDKQKLIEAVLDDYTEDVVESVIVWNEMRPFDDIPGGLRECVASFRRTLYVNNGPRPMIAVLEEIGVRDAFLTYSVAETVACIDANLVAHYAEYHQIAIDFVYEMFCVTIFGVIGLLKVDPNISDETLMRVIAQTLRLDT